MTHFINKVEEDRRDGQAKVLDKNLKITCNFHVSYSTNLGGLTLAVHLIQLAMPAFIIGYSGTPRKNLIQYAQGIALPCGRMPYLDRSCYNCREHEHMWRYCPHQRMSDSV